MKELECRRGGVCGRVVGRGGGGEWAKLRKRGGSGIIGKGKKVKIECLQSIDKYVIVCIGLY